MLGIFLAAVDGTVVTTAMPTAVRSLGGLDLYAWVFAIYMLTTAVSMPLWGKLADARGSRGLFVFGVAIFVVGSALSGAAATMGQLVAFRALQGIGAGAMTAIPFTIVGLAFPPEQRARALGIAATTWGIASVVGPLLGSAIVSLLGWRWVFYVNVPVGMVAVWLAARYVPSPPSAAAHHQRVDWLGAVLVATGVTALLLALLALQGGAGGSLAGPLVAALAGLAALVSLVAFAWVESRAAEPVLAPFLFRRPIFVVANTIAFLSYFAIFGVIDYLPLLSPPGVSPAVGAAILIFPTSVCWSISSFTAGRLVRRLGVRPIVFAGTGLMAAGTGAFLLLTGPQTDIFVRSIVALPIGLGIGALTPSLLSAVQNALPPERMGMGTAAQQFLRQVGGTLGVSTLQLVFLIRLAAAPPAVRDAAQALLLNGTGAGMAAPAYEGLSSALGQSFVLPLAAAVLALVCTWAVPREAR